jgi:protein-tyrosine phosphatase
MIDVELYGGKRGFLEHLRARTLYVLGAYRSVGAIEWAAVRRLVFVCKGNICRSPYACARARSLGVTAVSWGLDASGGASADPSALKNALARGIDLSRHQSTRLESARLADGDVVIVFEPAHRIEVRRRIGDGIPASLLGIWSRPLRPHIQDPYGQTDRYFQQCFAVIDANLAKLIEHMARSGAPAVRELGTVSPSPGVAHGHPSDRTRM